jgi:hypothetical protein
LAGAAARRIGAARRLGAMELRADVLPARGRQNVAIFVDDEPATQRSELNALSGSAIT